MANSSTAANRAHVKAGYWFSNSELQVANIKSNLFTHLYAGFAKVQYPLPPGAKIDHVIIFPDNTGNFENFPQTVKAGTNVPVKALLSIGGQGDDAVSIAIANVARDAENGLRDAFIRRSIRLAREHEYDGLDLCWLYPSTTNHWKHLASFLNDWRRAVDEDQATPDSDHKPNKLLLTATVFHHPPVIDDNFGLFKAIKDNLDWINVLAIDFYTPYSNSTGETAPVHAWLNTEDQQDKCGSGGIRDWIAKGVAAQKLVLGLPFYGYQWILENPDNSGLFVPAHSAANSNPILYRNIPRILRNNAYEPKYAKDNVATYSHKDGIWIGYDDEQSISEKVKQAIGKDKLHGYFAWNLGGDDDNWTLSTAASNAWPRPEPHP